MVAFIEPEPPQFGQAEPLQRLKIIFAGDVMAHSPQVSKAKRGSGYDFKPCFRYIKPIFEAADLAIVNLETTLSDTAPYSGYPAFRAPAELAEALADAGVDVAVTANNHALDAGAKGVASTIEILARNGIQSTGTFRDSTDYTNRNPLIINRNGIRLALLSYTYGTNGIPTPKGTLVNLLDTLQMKADIARCKDADCTIAFLHWGAEYSMRTSREQRTVADVLHRDGCQVVIGSHPHVVQGAEVTKRAVTLYSLGNFISNQRTAGSDGGIIAQLEVVKDGDDCQFWVDIVPVWVRHCDYTVLPKSVGDTISLRADERAAYKNFMTNCAKIF
ncbi:MAG: CapA family protein [Alistipes sp.]|nr:CapA family protein [Alistipes sp.]